MTLYEGAQLPTAFEVAQNLALHRFSKVVAAPHFLDQGGTEGSNLLFKSLLMLSAGLRHRKDQLLEEPRLFAAVRD